MVDEKKSDDYAVDMGDKQPNTFEAEPRPAAPKPPASMASVANNPNIAILTYCGGSILMTVANKYVLSGTNFNLNFFLLLVQNVVCILAISTAKALGYIQYRDFNVDQAKKWFPVSLLLIGMIYTGTKSLQYLSIPVYTIFKNLTIILIAYGEVLWFGGSVTPMALLSFGMMVLSSVIAAWADIAHALSSNSGDALSGEAAAQISTLNSGYLWMLCNCFCSASFLLGMRKRIKLTNFADFDTMFYNNLLSIPCIFVCSLFLEDWSSTNLALNFPEGTRTYMAAAMIFTGLSSILISYASAWCVRVTSAATYSMVGALNKLPIAVSGLIFFDAPITFGSVGAIFTGFMAGVVYAVAKMRQKEAESGAAAQKLPTTSASSQSMREALKS